MPWRSIPRPLPLSAENADPYRESAAEEFGFDRVEFQQLLDQVQAKYLPIGSSARERARFVAGLRLGDLVLARACANGNTAAWEVFWTSYRAKLHAAARAMTRDACRGEELADSLFGDLFGLRTRDGERVSKLNSYMGLGSLQAWLYSLLAQAHVDHWRRERRLISLDANLDAGRETGLDANPQLAALLVPPNQDLGDASARRHLEAAVETALAGLAGDPKLLLSLYFLDGQTLAQIGQLRQVHESTVSRQLNRVLTQLRRRVLGELRGRGLDRAAAAAALRADPRGLGVEVRKYLHPLSPSDPS